MVVEKNIDLDLNRIIPMKTITIHQGDQNSINLVITLTNDSKGVDLTGKAVMYDAVINNILAEQNKVGSIKDSRIIIPITNNMTSHSGLLKIDVKLIEGTTTKSILFTQTITLIVERSVINGDTIIDAKDTTIEKQLNDFQSKLDSIVNDVYKKKDVDNLLKSKVSHMYSNSSTLETCDECTDWNTYYHLYIDGSYQILINTYGTGGQFRLTRYGEVYFRNYNYNESKWSSWSLVNANIPDNSITYEKLTDDYLRFYGSFSLDDVDMIRAYGVYAGGATKEFINKYDVHGRFNLIYTSYQLLIFPECNRMLIRYPESSGGFTDWIDISPQTDYLKEEKGQVGENYAWYTDESQGYSLSGTYSLIGDMCYLSGKVPLINGWRVVYYSLPVSSISSSVVLGKIDNDYFSISTSTLENHSVIELKRMDNSLMGSGEISFTLIYKYK